MTANGNKIKMTVGDYGKILPIIIKSDTPLSSDDSFKIEIFNKIRGKAIISKEYSKIKDNTIEFVLSKEESSRLNIGNYFYNLDWFQNNKFLENIIRQEDFIIESKAGELNNGNTN